MKVAFFQTIFTQVFRGVKKKFSKVNYRHNFLYYDQNFANVILIVKISVW